MKKLSVCISEAELSVKTTGPFIHPPSHHNHHHHHQKPHFISSLDQLWRPRILPGPSGWGPIKLYFHSCVHHHHDHHDPNQFQLQDNHSYISILVNMHTSIIAIENHDHEMNKKTLLKTNITLDALALNQQLIHQQHQNEKSSSTSPSSSLWPPATQWLSSMQCNLLKHSGTSPMCNNAVLFLLQSSSSLASFSA